MIPIHINANTPPLRKICMYRMKTRHYTCIPSTWEAEAGLGAPDHSRLRSKAISKTRENTHNTHRLTEFQNELSVVPVPYGNVHLSPFSVI